MVVVGDSEIPEMPGEVGPELVSVVGLASLDRLRERLPHLVNERDNRGLASKPSTRTILGERLNPSSHREGPRPRLGGAEPITPLLPLERAKSLPTQDFHQVSFPRRSGKLQELRPAIGVAVPVA